MIRKKRGLLFTKDGRTGADIQLSIVFSAWIRSLDAVASLFAEHDIIFRRVDGGIPHAKRKQMLSEFHDPSVRVLLITLGTGAVG